MATIPAPDDTGRLRLALQLIASLPLSKLHDFPVQQDKERLALAVATAKAALAGSISTQESTP